jgi:hypothetical protein
VYANRRALSIATLACAVVAFCWVTASPAAAAPVQQAYAKASNIGVGDAFGRSAAVDGATMVIGAPFEDSSATGVGGNQADNGALDSGAAYVFIRSGGTWTQQAYLKASNAGAGDQFGYSVAVEGDTIIVAANAEDSSATGVGGIQADNSAADSGAVYVFTRTAGTWTQQAYLKASNTGAVDQFGYSVALNGDTIAAGAVSEDSSATGADGNQADNSASGSGAAYVFTRTAGVWTQQSYLKASNTGGGDNFGQSVAMDGETIVVAALAEDSGATGVGGNQADNSAADSGAAYVFTRAAGIWTQQAYLKASNTGATDLFGYSIALEGETIVVGAFGESSSATGVGGNQANDSASFSGAAYVFTRSSGTWTQQAYLKASNTDGGDDFGWSVALDGDTIVVGAVGEASGATGVDGDQTDDSASFSGAAYVFTRSGVIWSQLAYLKKSDAGGAQDQFGSSVASDGDTIVAGAINESSLAENSGAAYVFVLQAASTTTLTCAPASRTIGQASTCTAAVTGTSPTGTVNFSAEGPGALGAPSCTLSAGSCSVTYTPSALGDATHTITADYQGDLTHLTSSDTDDITVNAPPTIDSGAAFNAAENQTAVTTVTSTDPDSDPLSYSISDGPDQAKFSIHPITGALSFNTAPDFEAPADAGADNVYDLTVQVADGNGGTDTEAIAIAVTNVNENPTITSAAAFNSAENQTAVSTVTSSDPENDPQTYSITGGPDQAKFSIHPITGALSFNTAPNFETPTDAGADNVYEVTVQVADGNGGTDTEAIAVTVTNVNEAPLAVNDTATKTEDSGATAIDVLANDTDVDGGAISILTASDPANGSVLISGGGSGLTYAPDADYCNSPPGTSPDTFTYTLNGGSQATVSVTVTCVDEPAVPPVVQPLGPSGQRAAALKKCKKIKKAAARKRCKRKASKLPV